MPAPYVSALVVELTRRLPDEPRDGVMFSLPEAGCPCESRLADLGFNQDVRDAVLGHAKIGIQRTYNKYDYADEKRTALDAYATHLVGLVG